MSETSLPQPPSRASVVEVPGNEALARLEHELRTPLTVISIAGHLLAPAAADAAGRAALAHLNKATGRLSEVVEDLLALARLGAERPLLSRAPVRLDQLARQAADEARTRGAAVALSAPEGPCVVLGEGSLIARAIGHLLDNAAKFGRQGATIRLQVEPHQRGFEVSVADDGPGVAPNLIAELFRPFYQPAHVMTREVGGLGVGLTIVRLTAETHGGVATAYSLLGEGSRFGLWLPCA